MNTKIHHVNDRRNKGYYFYWHGLMKLYPTRQEAEATLAQYEASE